MLNNGLVLLGVLLLFVAYIIYMRAERMQTNLPKVGFGVPFMAGGVCLLVAGLGFVK